MGTSFIFIAKITDWAVPLQRGFFIFDSKPSLAIVHLIWTQHSHVGAFYSGIELISSHSQFRAEFCASELLSVFEQEVVSFRWHNLVMH